MTEKCDKNINRKFDKFVNGLLILVSNRAWFSAHFSDLDIRG